MSQQVKNASPRPLLLLQATSTKSSKRAASWWFNSKRVSLILQGIQHTTSKKAACGELTGEECLL
jgi:hypothetical protein